MENMNDMIGKLTEFLRSEAKTETIIGQQFQLGGYTCVPVMALGLGIGGGGGEGKGKMNTKDAGEGEGMGTMSGAGMGLGPVGFLVANENSIQFISTRVSKGLDSLIEKAPDFLDAFLKNKKETAAN